MPIDAGVSKCAELFCFCAACPTARKRESPTWRLFWFKHIDRGIENPPKRSFSLGDFLNRKPMAQPKEAPGKKAFAASIERGGLLTAIFTMPARLPPAERGGTRALSFGKTPPRFVNKSPENAGLRHVLSRERSAGTADYRFGLGRWWLVPENTMPRWQSRVTVVPLFNSLVAFSAPTRTGRSSARPTMAA